jgi:hypothetical protein
MKLYLLQIWNDIDPVLHGPYKTEALRNKAAKRYRGADPEGNNGLFPLDVPTNSANRPTVHTYSGAFFNQGGE